MVPRALLVVAFLAVAPVEAGQPGAADPVAALVARLEQAGGAADSAAVIALGRTPDAPGLTAFAGAVSLPPSRFIIKERDRGALSAETDRLLLEVFAQYGNEAVITTWRVDVTAEKAPPGERRIAAMEQLSVVSGLHRLALNPGKQFEVRNLVVRATDLTLELPSGHAFMAETAEGPTAVVLLGRGRMRFAPSDAAERTQVRIFAGEEALDAEFDAAFIRVRPADFTSTFGADVFVPRTVHASDFRRASDVFDSYIGHTLQLDLTDLSRERWSLIPSAGDLIAEVRTRRRGSLTYTRSSKDSEDISLFDRRRRRNISVYASPQKLAGRGRFYSEDQTAEYDVQRYDLDVAYSPDRLWIDGHVQMALRVRAYILTSITLRLAEPLVVRSITSPELGRLLHMRVVGQNSVILNLPSTVARDTELTLNIVYGGRLEPQQVEQEALAMQPPQQQVEVEQAVIPIEPQYVYSNRSYWYPQAVATDYATARIRISVPAEFDVVASGVPTSRPAAGTAERPEAGARNLFVFEANRPVRYLACVVSRMDPVATRELPLPIGHRGVTAAPGVRNAEQDRAVALVAASVTASGTRQQPGAVERAGLALSVLANPRQTGRARSLADRAASILQYYAALIGGAPYESFTLAVTENELPGGHSPAYFAVLNHPPPTMPLLWRNDPVVFEGYQHFFLAHEIAHQWWGHAVGWKNYHEQWLSEGFAQYFAAMYAERDRGDETFRDILRQMRRWSLQQSSQGPVYLGYRLGHIRGDGRVFRALVYNKGAMVLHMLRRMLGDDAFFAGIRRFYGDWRFRKAGTDDFRQAMEAASGRELSAFFEGWVYGFAVPKLRFTSRVSGSDVQIRFEHLGDVVPVPVTVTLTYTDGRSEEVVIEVAEKSAERALRLNGALRSVDANRDHAAVAEISR